MTGILILLKGCFCVERENDKLELVHEVLNLDELKQNTAKKKIRATELTESLWLSKETDAEFNKIFADEVFCVDLRVDIVDSIILFKYLSENTKHRIAQNLIYQKLSKDQVIFEEGTVTNSLYIIMNGIVELRKNESVIRTLTNYAYFGEKAMLLNQSHSLTAVCRSENVQLWKLEKELCFSVLSSTVLNYLVDVLEAQNEDDNLDHFEYIDELGKGSLGIVRKVRHRRTKKEYALKCVSKMLIKQKKHEQLLDREKKMIKSNKHPFIVYLANSFLDDRYYYFLLEYCKLGDLFGVLQHLQILDKEKAKFYFANILLALEYLHDKKMLFRDLKPENILVSINGYLKLSDFGCAKEVDFRTNSIVGTPNYMAPEVLLARSYSGSCDIWSLGVMLYEFLFGPLPFGNDSINPLEICRSILMNNLTFPENYTDKETKNFIDKLLQKNPINRLGCGIAGFTEIKNHAFFTDFNWEALINQESTAPYTANSLLTNLQNERVKFNEETIKISTNATRWVENF
uniref:cGMP-dependent protein kinase n=1 Tax=Dermatophagoides pteronyssinus TaxID=6956 RepID=A0A6P6YD76_DERPT|nr:cAMP-dependent protein kinase catalytic subunit alpha-like [Dermatophagoides pteronyssinus]